MSGWEDWIFGNLPPPSPPARPTSTGAPFGAGAQAMPVSQNIDDRRSQGPDYRVDLRKAPGNWGGEGGFIPSDVGGGAGHWQDNAFGGYDPLLASPLITAGRNVRQGPVPTGPYAPSYQQNLPPAQSDLTLQGPRTGFTTSNDVPYIGPHLPISPGDPGWTSPPSPSGPHNPGGDPNRPGYGPAIGSTNAASQPSYQQLINFLQSWGGTS